LGRRGEVSVTRFRWRVISNFEREKKANSTKRSSFLWTSKSCRTQFWKRKSRWFPPARPRLRRRGKTTSLAWKFSGGKTERVTNGKRARSGISCFFFLQGGCWVFYRRRREKNPIQIQISSHLSLSFLTFDRRAKPSVFENRASFLLVRVSVLRNEGCGGSDREKKV